jgi:hypothetical protein
LNGGLPENPKVRLRQQGKNLIHLTPLERQPDPPNTAVLKREISRRWSDVELIDIVKEVDLRVNFTAAFRTTAKCSIRRCCNADSCSACSASGPMSASGAWPASSRG